MSKMHFVAVDLDRMHTRKRDRLFPGIPACSPRTATIICLSSGLRCRALLATDSRRVPSETHAHTDLEFQIFSDFIGRPHPLVTAPENPRIRTILCQNGARGGT